ncbi:uncharacterized protein LOC119725609 isoform X2 [Patiria miniata]|uniref:Uncharacterized protein n=1 Tax=Patiria miniata TaxID=46514 RepID=A0A913ZMH9_PATMI|nr:uncharacterized protein LOC119725609 isoform X2 [Patiria miniata]
METAGNSQEESQSIDTITEENQSSMTSLAQSNPGGSLSYDRLLDPTKTEESKHRNGSDWGSPQVKFDNGQHTARNEANTDPCNNIEELGNGRPRTPSAMEDGIPEMFPRDADVLPTAILVSCCCPVCGCVAISLASKARRLRQAGKYHASAQATEASTWWAWSAALSGCFILLGLALSVMIFLLMKYI